MKIEKQLTELGIELPGFGPKITMVDPMEKRKHTTFSGVLFYLSGHRQVQNGEVLHPGQIGTDWAEPQGYTAAWLMCIKRAST
ncbi:hypothetical protein [Algirhabdus cladophorae]|uniref:hypothetical protein n=1 Tax=Algirhabdus cladophorae TaxID=3377108 RepID=UPI003B84B03A